jgi:hypothetical protein
MSANPNVDQPKLYSHCALLYAKLDSNADEDHVWQGSIIDASRQVGINIGSYSRVVNALRKLGCIEQVKQGYRGNPSIYRIHFPPTDEVWLKNAPDRTEDLTRAPSSDTMAAQIKDIQKQLGGIVIVDAFKNIEDRLQKVERQVKELNNGKTEV